MARALFFFSFFFFLLSLLCNANIRLRVGRSAINSRHRHFSMFPSGADCQGEARISLTAGPHKTGEPSPGANSGSLLHHCRLCYCNICRGGSHCLLFNKSINKRRLQHVQYNATFFFFFFTIYLYYQLPHLKCVFTQGGEMSEFDCMSFSRCAFSFCSLQTNWSEIVTHFIAAIFNEAPK